MLAVYFINKQPPLLPPQRERVVHNWMFEREKMKNRLCGNSVFAYNTKNDVGIEESTCSKEST